MRRNERRNPPATYSPNGTARSALVVAELREGPTVRLYAVIELDLGGLTFMDSSGVHIALEARDRALLGGHALRLLEGAATIQRIFELTGTEHLFEFRMDLRGPP
jgi:anti-anti-sigma factor